MSFYSHKHFSSLILFVLFWACPTKLQMEEAHEKEGRECHQKWFPAEGDSFVCVCSGQYCDEPSVVGELGGQGMVLFTSDREKNRLHRQTLKWGNVSGKEEQKGPLLVVDASSRFQTLLGFGGAFTDSAGINLNSLSWAARENVLRAYFDQRAGIGYSLGRVPVASTDFSTREYSYLDQERDFLLNSFSLAQEDLEAKIPHIRRAQMLSGNGLKLIASPWASPAWMKSNGRMSGDGQLKGDLDGPYYKAYASYLKRFFDEYNRRGVQFWGMTLQNQPESGLDTDLPFQTMFVSNHTQRQFAVRHLAPLFRQSAHTANLTLIAFDDVRENLLSSTKEIFFKEDSFLKNLICVILRQFLLLPEFFADHFIRLLKCANEDGKSGGENPIAGIGVHWYVLEGHEQQSAFHTLYPDKFILSTEACTGFLPENQGPNLGNWTRGWMYGHDILANLRHWAVGWVDWNLCLDQKGGPNWAHNFVDAPIIVDSQRDQFYKQPMFYFLAHFSKFLPPGSVRIDSRMEVERADHVEHDQIDHVAFETPNAQKVLVLMGPLRSKEDLKLRIKENQSGRETELTLGRESIVTAIWS